MNLLNNFYLYLSRLMGKMYTNISTFLDSRQKIAGMTGDFGVIPEVFVGLSSGARRGIHFYS